MSRRHDKSGQIKRTLKDRNRKTISTAFPSINKSSLKNMFIGAFIILKASFRLNEAGVTKTKWCKLYKQLWTNCHSELIILPDNGKQIESNLFVVQSSLMLTLHLFKGFSFRQSWLNPSLAHYPFSQNSHFWRFRRLSIVLSLLDSVLWRALCFLCIF